MTITARPWLDRIDPYQPGRHAGSSEGSMASNESALGASAQVAEAIREATSTIHRYPDPLATRLREELADLHGVDPEQILVGDGSDELIYQLAWCYLAAGGTALCAHPAYRIDEISALVVGAQVVGVPLVDWTHDLETMATVPADIAYVVNPHNPTGTIRSRSDIEFFVANTPASLVVVDEAYIDYCDDPQALTALPLVQSGRVVVLRTFSKIYGLAGLRVGYVIGPGEVISALRKVRAPFSVGTLAQAGAVAALRDQAHHQAARDHTRRSRAQMMRMLTDAGLKPIVSQANFILVPVGDEDAMVRLLASNGISVRPGSALGFPGAVRISVPGDKGLALLATALKTLPASGVTA